MRSKRGETAEQILERRAANQAAKAKVSAGTEQLSLDDVKNADPQDVADALAKGQLRDLGYAAPRRRNR